MEIVGTLKEFIKKKKKHTLQHVDADTLMLWKVSMPYSALNAPPELPAGEPLFPVKMLSEIFPNHQVGESIDVIIKPPQPPPGK